MSEENKKQKNLEEQFKNKSSWTDSASTEKAICENNSHGCCKFYDNDWPTANTCVNIADTYY